MICILISISDQKTRTRVFRPAPDLLLGRDCKFCLMTRNRQVLTLDEFTIQQLRNFPRATGELSNLLRDIGLAAKRVNVEVNKAGLVDILGDAGEVNVQGEQVKKLDQFANHQFLGVLRHGISCAGIGSEEMDEVVVFDDEVSNQSKYVCLFDPLDGSSNIDVNSAIGTIFGVYRRVTEKGTACAPADLHAMVLAYRVDLGHPDHQKELLRRDRPDAVYLPAR